jgi:GT2 family glycosyltransferase
MVLRSPAVAVLIVTYGKRWYFLSQVLDRVFKDSHVSVCVVVDNGSDSAHELDGAKIKYGEKLEIVRSEKNLGSAGGFALGLEKIRSLDCEYVLILDDDNLPDEGTIESFLKLRKTIPEEKVVLVGNRVDLPHNEDVFYGEAPGPTEPKGTFFESITREKLSNFSRLLTHTQKKSARQRESRLFVQNESFVYGGAFIPIEAIREAPLPDRNLVLYGDDIEYSWGIKRLGYASYVCFEPKIHDLEISFGEESQAVGLFDPHTRAFRVYYRIRNIVLISRRNTKQSKLTLFLLITLWVHALFLFGAVKYGISRNLFKKMKLIYRAWRDGYYPGTEVPKEAMLP